MSFTLITISATRRCCSRRARRVPLSLTQPASPQIIASELEQSPSGRRESPRSRVTADLLGCSLVDAEQLSSRFAALHRNHVQLVGVHRLPLPRIPRLSAATVRALSNRRAHLQRRPALADAPQIVVVDHPVHHHRTLQRQDRNNHPAAR